MGRSLGYFDSEELDRPELNKCPECECYFASEECPLCGKVCPEAFRAGNRAPVKKKKHKNSSGRVQFIPWYYSWWFILVMMFVMPVVGVILFFTSPYSKGWKIAGVIGGLVYFVFIYLGVGWMLFDMIFSEDLVNADISHEAYVEKCEPSDVKSFYYQSGSEDDYVEMTVLVKSVLLDSWDEDGAAVYYVCVDPANEDISIFVRHCLVEEGDLFWEGDLLRVYGEGAGMATIFLGEHDESMTKPCLHMAYAEAAHATETTETIQTEEASKILEAVPAA
ncbi:MAG: hypothetical protein IJW90_00230 [Clostridia bacterium]|nr:hypothetical protein [Clostridia bacterium]